VEGLLSALEMKGFASTRSAISSAWAAEGQSWDGDSWKLRRLQTRLHQPQPLYPHRTSRLGLSSYLPARGWSFSRSWSWKWSLTTVMSTASSTWSARPPAPERRGDGKIFVHPVVDVIRVRTKERGSEAV